MKLFHTLYKRPNLNWDLCHNPTRMRLFAFANSIRIAWTIYSQNHNLILSEIWRRIPANSFAWITIACRILLPTPFSFLLLLVYLCTDGCNIVSEIFRTRPTVNEFLRRLHNCWLKLLPLFTRDKRKSLHSPRKSNIFNS